LFAIHLSLNKVAICQFYSSRLLTELDPYNYRNLKMALFLLGWFHRGTVPAIPYWSQYPRVGSR